MSASDFRFTPPAIELPAALDWLLAAAFGPAPPQPPRGAGTEQVASLAAEFGLGPRIVARHGARALGELLGDDVRPLLAAHRRAVALTLAADEAARRLADLAAAAAAPAIFLKGYALHLLRPGKPGLRPFVDLDVLVPEADADGLRQRLVADGWRALAGPANEQHLAPLVAPQGLPVDLHFRLRGVRLGAGGWVTADELLAGGLCQPAPGLAPPAAVPELPLIAAHLLAHGIEQHGYRPSTYALFWLLADLSDLLPAGALPAPLAVAIAESVSARELAAALRLSALLAAGEPVSGGDGGSDRDAHLLLCHIVAGRLDATYRDSLRIRHTAGRLRTARSQGGLLRYISGKLYPSDGAIEAQYGRPPSRWGYLRRRLLRPPQLVAGMLRSALARRRTRRRPSESR